MSAAFVKSLSIVAGLIMLIPVGYFVLPGAQAMEVPPAGDTFIVEAGAGVPRSCYAYTPNANGNLTIEIENHGLTSVRIVVLDVMELNHKPMWTQTINFAALDEGPTSTVTTDQIQMVQGIEYTIIAKDPTGPSGSYAVLRNSWVPDVVTEPTWTPAVTVAADGTYNSLSMAVTENAIYLTSWEWPYGAVSAFSSVDGGTTWTEATGLPYSLVSGHSDVCAYSVGDGQDVVLIVTGEGYVYKSVDNGLTFSLLAVLPLGTGSRWSYMSIGTNASWTGAPVGSDIYVVGGLNIGGYWSDAIYLSITKSTDGGLTWSTPKAICPFYSYYPEITSDGTDLYLVFDGLVDGPEYACMYAMKSADWGETWTTPTLIFERTYLDGGANPCTLQYIGNGKAVVTISDHRPVYPDIRGTWAVLDLATLTLDVKGFVMGSDWQVDLGFTGHLMPDGRFALGWLYSQPWSGLDDIKFTYGTNLGF